MLFFRYLNFLSLDAVGVALVWQELFARTGKISLTWQERVLLGLAVWSVYLTDHLLDSWNLRNYVGQKSSIKPNALRHHFIADHRQAVIVTILLALSGEFLLSYRLPLKMLFAGILLGAVSGCYLLLNGFLLARNIWPKGKEVAIAVIFAFGCGLIPLLQSQATAQLLGAILFFSLLCAMNCTLIARMERNIAIASLALLPTPRRMLLITLLLGVLVTTFYFINPLILAVLLSFFGLSFIPIIAQKHGYEKASIAADATLFLGALVALLGSLPSSLFFCFSL